jgi:hypothetical protein
MRIAFIQTSALGDCLLALPVLEELKRQHPHDSITWIIFDEYREIAARCRCCDHITWPLEPGIPRQVQEHERWREILRYAHANFDKAVIPQIYPFHMPWDAPERRGLHMLDQMFLNAGLTRPKDVCLYSAFRGVMIDPHDTDFYSSKDVESRPQTIAVNSVSRTQLPFWSDKEWDALRGHLKDAGYEMIDGDAGGHSLWQWRYRIKYSSAYIGLDSGGSWIAATTLTPQIVLRSSKATCPDWLTGVKAARVKDDWRVHELTDPTPEQVAEKVKEALEAKASWRRSLDNWRPGSTSIPVPEGCENGWPYARLH